MSAADRARLERAVEAMVASSTWREMLQRYRWNDRYLAGEAFERFLGDEEARVVSILDKLTLSGVEGLGTGTVSSSASGMGRYPMAVFGGLLLTVIAFMRAAVRPERAVEGRALDGESNGRAIAVIALAIALSVILIEAAGFVVSSIVLFWLTARAFDARHPMRDAIAAVVLSVGAYLLFVRLLQIQLP